MVYTTEQLEQYHKSVKNILISKLGQNEYRGMLDSLYNAIFTQKIFPLSTRVTPATSNTYINEEHNVRADS
jgi:protoporphyrinogen oxidase